MNESCEYATYAFGIMCVDGYLELTRYGRSIFDHVCPRGRMVFHNDRRREEESGLRKPYWNRIPLISDCVERPCNVGRMEWVRCPRNFGTSAWRTVITALSASLVVACIGCSMGLACPLAAQMRTIISAEEDLTSGIDAPAIVEVTIMGFTKTGVVARVEKVFKGQIDSTAINIIFAETSCHLGIAIGVRGIVVGALQRDAQGTLKIMALEETFVDRERRRTPDGNK